MASPVATVAQYYGAFPEEKPQSFRFRAACTAQIRNGEERCIAASCAKRCRRWQ